MTSETQLSDWRGKALHFEQQINHTVIGQRQAVRDLLLAVFARGHVLLEGQVGVGKTTLLRAMAQGLGGHYQRVEGTIDLMPSDLIYYTYLNSEGRPCVDPGPLLKQGEQLSIFFFNEINRARPQVHSLLLRVMAERSVNAFNRDYAMPHVQVFADRNRVEREETFELPAAARDRFMMEIGIEAPSEDAVLDELMFNPRFHDVDSLIATIDNGLIAYYQLNRLAAEIQQHVQTSPTLHRYALDLWKAGSRPTQYGIRLSDVEMAQLIQAGASPRGMSYFIRAAKVRAWLEDRSMLLPEDMQAVFQVTMAHRIFLNPMYGYRREELMPAFIEGILNGIAAP
ncbi:AAA family ATPase [Methylomonas methanica]|uniref:ATPase associated with various cellular activities AAA_3 n=1 Tax=Methylomonas methanica (strain DSM 25384 / MC09) TaxID=857087 RepID=G0A311_METMM|nr:MoxR family ATPase [Methylomonas methanica]AEG02670.1 ATPase associated with various cellular activities AAA_3 [Methylomonas methanica MC09]